MSSEYPFFSSSEGTRRRELELGPFRKTIAAVGLMKSPVHEVTPELKGLELHVLRHASGWNGGRGLWVVIM